MKGPAFSHIDLGVCDTQQAESGENGVGWKQHGADLWIEERWRLEDVCHKSLSVEVWDVEAHRAEKKEEA